MSKAPSMGQTASEAQIGFEGLAPEILLAILSQLTDLPSLRNLINTSPVAFRLFEAHGVDIIESVLTSGSMTKQIPEVIRVVALIRSSTLPFLCFGEFYERFVRQSMIQQKTEDSFLPKSLSANTSHVVLRSILASAHRISCLTPDCLKFYLDQLRTIEPEVLVDEKFTYRQGHSPDYSAIPAWKMRPEGRRLTIGKLEPPSWIEVQRVERAFWRVQFFYDLKMAAAQSLLSWPGDDLGRLQRMEPKDLYNKSSHAEYEEVNTIVDYIQELRAQDATNLQVVELLQLPLPRLEISKHCPIIVSGERDHDHLLIPAPACWRWRSLSSHSNSPLKYISFKPFRRFGFALWSRERMASLSLMNLPNQGRDAKSTDFYFFAWKSILSAEEILEAESAIEQKEQERRRDWESMGRLSMQ
ncbi:hypothetical protein N431DRAFT_428151 [Stipitochalara longipes BDJ]|nr:hypothetical protein N431DRAFT_428151 [Stipitochalara longipes BDJ]